MKRFLSMASVLCLSGVLLAGCGTKDNQVGTTPPATANTTNTQETTNAAANAEDNTKDTPAPVTKEVSIETSPASQDPKNTKVKTIVVTNATATRGNHALNPEGYPITLDKAIETFRAQYPQSQLTKVGLDSYYNSFRYKIKGVEGNVEREMKIDALSGDLLKDANEQDHDALTKETISLDGVKDWREVFKLVQAKLGANTFVSEWELKADHGLLVYEFDMHSDQGSVDVTVNAKTGEILEIDD